VLGLDLATLSKDLRGKYKIKDSIKGVVITNVDGTSDAAEKRLSPGEVIVEVAQEAVSNTADVKKRIDQLKKDGKKSVLLLVANSDGELRFVALSVQ
jgi:serine protease Do